MKFVQFGTFDFKNGNIVKEISTRLETEVKFQLSNLLKTKSPLLPCEALDEPHATMMNYALQGCRFYDVLSSKESLKPLSVSSARTAKHRHAEEAWRVHCVSFL